MSTRYKYLFFDLDHTLWDFEANSRQTLEEIVECRWIAKRVPHQRRDSRRDGQSIAITGATGCGKSFLAMVISSEAIERGYNVRYWSLSELMERLSKLRKNLRR